MALFEMALLHIVSHPPAGWSSLIHRSLGSKRAIKSVQGPVRPTRLGTATPSILLHSLGKANHKGYKLNFLMEEVSKSCWKGHGFRGAWSTVPFLQSIYLGIGGLIIEKHISG